MVLSKFPGASGSAYVIGSNLASKLKKPYTSLGGPSYALAIPAQYDKLSVYGT